MPTTVIDEAGKIEIPAEYRERRSVKPGDIVRIVEQPDGRLVLKIGKDAMSLVGKFSNNGIHLSLEDINRVISEQGLKK